MMKPVAVASWRSVRDEIGGSSAEPGPVGISVHEEKTAALEESMRKNRDALVGEAPGPEGRYEVSASVVAAAQRTAG